MFRNGVPDSVNTYNTPNVVDNRLLDQSLYLQDKWQAGRRLTINMGVRIQKSVGWVPAGCQVETIFIAARCFDKVEDIPNWLNAAPRFGVVYDLFGDGKTALKATANRYYLTIGVGHAARVNPMRTTTDTRRWVDANNDEIPQLSELGPSTGFNLGTTNRYNPDVKRPYANELSVEIERQLPLDIVASVGYTYRATRREIGSKNLAVPLESYIPLEVTERTSGRQVTVYNQDPSVARPIRRPLRQLSGLDSAFNGLDVTVNKRMTGRWMVMAGLSLGKNIGDIYGTGDLNNPNLTFRRGRIEFDVPGVAEGVGRLRVPVRHLGQRQCAALHRVPGRGLRDRGRQHRRADPGQPDVERRAAGNKPASQRERLRHGHSEAHSAGRGSDGRACTRDVQPEQREYGAGACHDTRAGVSSRHEHHARAACSGSA